MTRDEMYQKYLEWEKGPVKKPMSDLFELPIKDVDVYENEHLVLNRQYYLVPHFDGKRMDCFIFYESNMFVKSRLEELELVMSTIQVQGEQ